MTGEVSQKWFLQSVSHWSDRHVKAAFSSMKRNALHQFLLTDVQNLKWSIFFILLNETDNKELCLHQRVNYTAHISEGTNKTSHPIRTGRNMRKRSKPLFSQTTRWCHLLTHTVKATGVSLDSFVMLQ